MHLKVSLVSVFDDLSDSTLIAVNSTCLLQQVCSETMQIIC